MCIVIDANALAAVFNETCSDHRVFEPVRKWVVEGDGFVVFGGTKYKKELRIAFRYLRLFRLLKDAGRAIEIKTSVVDQEEKRIRQLTAGTKCNDQHVIAIFAASGCRLFCSVDVSADMFIKDRRLYPTKHVRPAIYRNQRHKHLLCQKNIVPLRNIG